MVRNACLCVAVFLLPMELIAADTPEILHVGMVSPDIIGITIQAGRSEYGCQVPYEAAAGDTVDDEAHHRWVKREGKLLGSLVGADRKLLYTPDRVVGRKLDTGWADTPANYRIRSKDDPAFAEGVAPAQVFRKSKPSDLARTGPWAFDAPVRHVIYLKLPRVLTLVKRYELTFERGALPARAFTYDPRSLRSEAVHTTQLGFRPDDPVKIAYLSCWLGSGGALSYPDGLVFEVINARSGDVVYRGKVEVSKRADDKSEDAYKRNYNGTDVHKMDFSTVTKPGTYRVSVAGIGCSYPFRIEPDVWRKAFVTSACGFYHQRNGIELGPPYTDFKRPRPFHPGDGVKIHASSVALMDTGNGLNRKDSNFGELVKNGTDELVTDAWGGYMDAGDWDRRIQHLVVSRLLLELAALFPETFANVSLNIPESGNDVPDIVDEALFNLDCYRRMQTPEGGIRGGIESSEHPRHGEGSWQESLTIYAYAPGVWSSYEYAGVAARASYWLRERKPELAEIYRESALRAMAWAEKELPGRENRKDAHDVRDSRNLAAAELFRLTGETKWHDLFLATTAFKDPAAQLFVWQKHDQDHAAWVYLRTERDGRDESVRKNCLRALLVEADDRAKWTGRTGFGWTKNPWRPTGWGALAAPDGLSLARAHAQTGSEKYLRALVLASQTGAGANPVNICYTTGLGQDWPRHPLHIDSRITHQSPPPGITVVGPFDVSKHKDYWGQKLVARFCHPPVQQWPTLEAFWDVFWYPPMCEFTVQTPMAENAYVWGYLAARGGK